MLRRGLRVRLAICVAMAVFPFAVGASASSLTVFSNGAAVGITDCCLPQPAGTYALTVPVSGLSGSITSVTATLKGLTHGATGDLDVLLVAPGGQSVVLMSDTGVSASGANLSFADTAPTGLPAGTPLVSGSYKPTNGGEDCPGMPAADVFPAPAPVGPYGSTMAALNASAPNGIWSLFVVDDCEVDAGVLAGGLDLSITTSGTGGSPSNPAAVTLTDCCAAARAATYASTITVSGVTGQTTGLTVTLRGLSHGRVADLQVLLVGPGGQSALLLSDTGGAASGADLTFANAGSMVPATGAVTTGTYVPTDRPAACAGPTTPPFPSPAPAGPYGSSISVFTGLGGGNVNGAWSLYVTDVCPGDGGSLALGWSLDISNNPTAVVVSSFSAKRVGKTRMVRLRWRTGQETSLLGFYLYRGQTKISRQLVVARSRGGTKGGSYSFTDKTAKKGTSYTYRLQTVGMDGKKTFARTARLAAK